MNLQAPDLGQAHTECGEVKHVCWRQNLPLPESETAQHIHSHIQN